MTRDLFIRQNIDMANIIFQKLFLSKKIKITKNKSIYTKLFSKIGVYVLKMVDIRLFFLVKMSMLFVYQKLALGGNLFFLKKKTNFRLQNFFILKTKKL